MSDKVFMYGDEETIDILNRDIPKVILFGGYLGYSNFGDILQLKEAIKFHTTVTKLEPVVICNVISIPDKDFLSRLRMWFGVRAFIFVHDLPVDLTFLEMKLIDAVLPIANLHLYGGGFLNRYWGDHLLKLVEGLLNNFKVGNYIIGGQQIDAALSNRLKIHFERHKPKLIGVRDFESQKIVNSMGFSCEFSFDDASNIIETWARRKPEHTHNKESLFIHLNSSKYIWDKSDEHREELNRIVNVLSELSERFKTCDPVLMSAYSECRISVRDTLPTVTSLEDSFPFLDYRVLDIAHMALQHDPASADADNNLTAFGGGVAISCSYHTAMFCNMLKTPCYLMSHNAYYQQKQTGLGESRTFEQFLDSPTVLSYATLMEQRESWLKKLPSFFDTSCRKSARDSISLTYPKSELKTVPFHFKEANVVERENFTLKGELGKIIDVLKEKSCLIERLQNEADISKSGITTAENSSYMKFVSLVRQILGLQRK